MSAVRPPKSGLADLGAVRRCDRAFDALAARRDAHFDDPAVQLLTALVTDVDADMPRFGASADEATEEEQTPAPVRVRPDDHRSRQNTAWFRTRLLGTRAALAASAVVAALTITGVAATNIGHFEPVGQVLGIGGGPSPSATDQVEEALATAGGLIEEGRYADARQALNLARKRAGRLNGPHQDSLAGKIHRLEAQLARESSGQQTATGAPRDQRNASPEPSTEPGDSVTNVQVPDLPDAAGNGADNVTGGEPGTAGGGSDGGESGGADGDGTGVPPDTPTTEASEDGPEPVGSGDSAGQQPMIGDIAGSSAPSAADDGKLNGKGKAQGKEGKAQGKGRGRRP